MKRVNEEELEYDYDDYGAALLAGEPFTGEAIDKSGDVVVSLTTFVGGREDGPKKEWYESGQIRSEGQVSRVTGAIGVWSEWNESGQLVERKELDEEGNVVSWRQWDEEGVLIKDEAYDPLW
ncbi:toxin-antitoxin system YwqK family antitoxin [Nocardiopsis alba]|jgi:antitoxin component YwqK of YwqJK toxin-antitoxin module|uniref:toxin-antitoxin system YwqK family antitoxin n=1 Tax=Nocardiopsis alba TaxID=53437 RepID=UPI0033D297F1